MNRKTVTDYYDYMTPFYRFFWHVDTDSNALHYGLWEKDTQSFKESLLNMNRFLAKKASITKSDNILDAGCGVGGSSIWLAKNFGVEVTGITLSEKQLAKAKSLAKKNRLDNLLDFHFMDFLKTQFADESFDVVWALESVCYVENKVDFFREAYRILKKGGRLIIGDGFPFRNAANEHEQEILDEFTKGWALPRLITPVAKYREGLEKIGFKKIKFWDKTKETLPTVKRIYWLCKLSYPVVKTFETLRLTSPILTFNHRAGIVQYEAVKIGLGGYGVFYAEK